VLARLVAGLLERELIAVDDRLALRARRALQRHRRVDRQRLAAAFSATAAVVVTAARADAQGESADQAAHRCQPT
jgi:hypothetical protein